MEREALKLALEVLEDLPGFRADIDNAIAAIKEVLAQPEQEPVAWMVKAHGLLQRLSRRADVADEIACQYRKDDPKADMFPLYTAPPQRKPLTDEEIVKITSDPCLYIRGGDYRIDIARAIEAAHGIKE
jgi:hypothetical protein